MVKAVSSKSSHAYKVGKQGRSVPVGSPVVPHDSSVVGVKSPPLPDSDEDESVDYSVGGLDRSSFDTCVDRCFMIREIGSVRKVSVAGVMKDVYNVTLITPLGVYSVGGVATTGS